MSDQPTLPLEARARTGDPSTSHDAAASITGLRASQSAVYRVLRHLGPSTDEEIADFYSLQSFLPPQSPSGLRTRRFELVAAGKVRDTGERRKMTTGRKAIVWEVVT